MKITMSKSQWEAVGKKAGWMKKAEYNPWDELYGVDSDDGYDAMKDFGGDIDDARRHRVKVDADSEKKEKREKILKEIREKREKKRIPGIPMEGDTKTTEDVEKISFKLPGFPDWVRGYNYPSSHPTPTQVHETYWVQRKADGLWVMVWDDSSNFSTQWMSDAEIVRKRLEPLWRYR